MTALKSKWFCVPDKFQDPEETQETSYTQYVISMKQEFNVE